MSDRRSKTSGNRRGFGTRWGMALTLMVALVLLLAACGGDDTSDTTVAPEATSAPETTEAMAPETTEAMAAETTVAPETTEAMAPPEQAELKVGILPIVDVAPLYIAEDRGFFAEEGLTVTTEFAAGGAAVIPAVVSGDLDIGFGAYPSTFSAVSQGLPLSIINEGVRSAEGFSGLMVMPDSGLAEVADLAGETIAVNTLNNLGQLVVEDKLIEAGLTLDDVDLIEVPFPDMIATLERGDVAAIWTVEPFTTVSQLSIGAEMLVDTFTGATADFPIAGYFVTADFAAENPHTVAAFQRALIKATAVANDEPDSVPAIVPTYTRTDEATALELSYPVFVAEIDNAALQVVIDYMLAAGILDEDPGLSSMVVPTP